MASSQRRLLQHLHATSRIHWRTSERGVHGNFAADRQSKLLEQELAYSRRPGREMKKGEEETRSREVREGKQEEGEEEKEGLWYEITKSYVWLESRFPDRHCRDLSRKSRPCLV